MAKTGKTFRDSATASGQILRDINAGKLAPIYLLMGEEPYFIDIISDAIAASTVEVQYRDFNQTILYGRDTDTGLVVNYCRQIPMMPGKQLILIKEAQQLKKIETLVHYVQSPSDSTVLVLCHKGKNLDKRSQLYKLIDKNGLVFESISPRDYEIGSWITDHLREQGFNIEPKALQMLTDHLGANIPKVTNELSKLLIYLPEHTRQITAADVEQNVGISKDFNNFELTRAISERSLRKCILIADHFARNPKDNPLVVTISTLFTHFQRIFILNYQKWLCKNRNIPLPDEMQLCRMLKIASPFFLREYKQASELYPNRKVFNIMGYIREYDMKSKGLDNASTDDGQLLKELLLKIIYA